MKSKKRNKKFKNLMVELMCTPHYFKYSSLLSELLYLVELNDANATKLLRSFGYEYSNLKNGDIVQYGLCIKAMYKKFTVGGLRLKIYELKKAFWDEVNNQNNHIAGYDCAKVFEGKGDV